MVAENSLVWRKTSGGEQCQINVPSVKTKETYGKERHSREELGVSPYRKVEN